MERADLGSGVADGRWDVDRTPSTCLQGILWLCVGSVGEITGSGQRSGTDHTHTYLYNVGMHTQTHKH